MVLFEQNYEIKIGLDQNTLIEKSLAGINAFAKAGSMLVIIVLAWTV